MRKTTLLYTLLSLLAFGLVHIAHAQLVGTNVFLQGSYVEVGMNGNGSFGACSSPAGYHPHPTCCATTWSPGAGLGIVYDWGHDGWSVGTTPYMGDYTYAGNPFEGWEIQINGSRAQAFQSCTGSFITSGGLSLTGTNVSYTNSCSSAIADWAGNAGGTLDIKMETRLDTAASWVVMNVKLRNTGSSPLTDIYYLRNCDPDGDETWTGGGFPTDNWIPYQNDGMHRVMVAARAFAHAYSFMGLGAKDARAVAFIYNIWPMPIGTDISTWWNQTNPGGYYSVGVHHNGDIAIGLVFNLGSLGPGDSTCFSYTYTFGDIPDLDSFSAPISAANNGPLCEGDTLKLFVSTTGNCATSWFWYGPGGFTSTLQNPVIPNATVADAGIYHVTRKNFCTATDTAATTVVINAQPAPIAGSHSICVGAATTLTDATPGGTWSSSNPTVATITPGGVVSGIATGTSTITYQTGSGCLVIFSISVFPAPGPLTNHTICQGQTVVFTDSIPGGTWTSQNTTVATIDATSGLVTGISGGVSVITYSFGGSCYATGTVTVNPLPDAGMILGASVACIGSVIDLKDTLGMLGGIWLSNNGNASVVGGVVNTLFPGIDTIMYIVSNSCGSDTAVKVITIVNLPVISGSFTMCVGQTTTLSGSVPGGTWNSSNIAVATVTPGPGPGIVTGISAGTSVITYTVDLGCAAIVTVTIYPLPDSGKISGSTRLCPGGTTTLSETVSGGKWFSSDTSIAVIDSATGTVTAMSFGTITITYRIPPNANGCTSKATFQLIVGPPTFTVNPTITTIKCYGDKNAAITVAISGGTGPYQYLWSTGATGTSIDSLVPGIYSLTVKETSTKCQLTDSFKITQPDSLSLTHTVTDDICKYGNGTITVTVSGGTTPYTYRWSNNAVTKDISNLVAQTYSLTVTDLNGCEKSLSDVVKDTCEELIIHNAISPNGDGINDTWVIEGIKNYPTNTVQVFDKWGDLIFERSNYQNDWDGTGKKGPVPDGTYYYLIKLNAKSGTNGDNAFTGYVMIKR